MRRLQLMILVVSFWPLPAFAQDGYRKIELYAGYSHSRVQPDTEMFTAFGETLAPCSSEAAGVLGENFQTSFCERRGFHGFDMSLVYNFSRFMGIKADVTGHYKPDEFIDTLAGTTESLRTNNRVHQFLVGLQLKDNRDGSRFKPLAHVLIGAGRQAFRGANTSPIAENNYTLRNGTTSIAMKMGGGMDLRVNRRFDVRLIEIDYNPIFTRDYDITGFQFGAISQGSKTSHNYSISIGMVLH